jgi:hypothetical protein
MIEQEVEIRRPYLGHSSGDGCFEAPEHPLRFVFQKRLAVLAADVQLLDKNTSSAS